MKWAHCLFAALLISFGQTENVSSETNEIDPKEAVKNLDPSIRQALLRAIDNLEKQTTEESEYENDETVSTSEEILDESSKGDYLLKSLLDIVASEKKMLENSNTSYDFANILEKTALRALNRQVPRSASQEINEVLTSKKNSTEPSRVSFVQIRRTTTTEPTTTTTRKPAPTHNADGENIEVVEQKDIKILPAPLVTAFTVQQDEQGTAKQVIPLFQPPLLAPLSSSQPVIRDATDNAKAHSTNVFIPTPLPSAASRVSSISSSIQIDLQDRNNEPSLFPPELLQNQSLPFPENHSFNFINPQPTALPTQQSLPHNNPESFNFNSVNDFLLQRQKQLEQQIVQLQLQAQRQQEQILLQQQFLLDHQRKQSTESELNQIKPNKSYKSNVTIRPSLELVPSVTQPPRLFEYNLEQQLPLRDIPNFRHNFNPSVPTQGRTTFPLQSSNQLSLNPSTNFIPLSPPVPLEVAVFQHLPQRPSQPFLPSLGPINSVNSINKVPSSEEKTRHFRQESGTGNFGFNPFFSQSPVFGGGTSYNPSEDLNIIYKVLALNHGINPYTPQNLHFTGQFNGAF